jgi:MYXO-CTERM domain-containing protein
VRAEESGTSVVDEHRFYPLAASYFKIDHPGGELLLGLVEDNRETLFFEVFPTNDSGVVMPALLQWQPDGAVIESLGTQPAGDYWLVGSYPAMAESSEVRGFCFGGPDAMDACTTAAGDTDTADPGGDTGESGDAVRVEADGSGAGSGSKGGCSAVSDGHWSSWLFVVLGIVVVGARRRS